MKQAAVGLQLKEGKLNTSETLTLKFPSPYHRCSLAFMSLPVFIFFCSVNFVQHKFTTPAQPIIPSKHEIDAFLMTQQLNHNNT